MEKWKDEVMNSCDEGTTFFRMGNDLRTGSEIPSGGTTKEIDISVQ